MATAMCRTMLSKAVVQDTGVEGCKFTSKRFDLLKIRAKFQNISGKIRKTLDTNLLTPLLSFCDEKD